MSAEEVRQDHYYYVHMYLQALLYLPEKWTSLTFHISNIQNGKVANIVIPGNDTHILEQSD